MTQEHIEFANKAAEYFSLHPKADWYMKQKGSISRLKESLSDMHCMIALRWGWNDDCIVVLELGSFEPILFEQWIKKTDTITCKDCK